MSVQRATVRRIVDGDTEPQPGPGVVSYPYPPDKDCSEIPERDFRVQSGDPHGFDSDNDGIGCES